MFLTVAAVLLALVSAFSILTGFGIIKNYTGLFEETTTEAAADTDKGSNYIYNSGVPQRLRKARLHPERASRPANDVVSQ